MRQSRLLTLISFSSTIVVPIFLALIALVPHVYVFWSVIVCWMAYYVFVYWKYHITKNETILQIMTAVSFVILLILTEFVWMRWLFVCASAPIFFFIAFWAEPRIDHGLHIKEKPLRRMMMVLYVFNVYALLVGLFAAHVFFPFISFLFLAFFSAVYSAIASYFIWRLYYRVNKQEIFVWACIVGIIVYECMWVLKLLPFGYLVLGFLLAWLWYVIQLLIRFHLSMQDVVWKKQWRFLLINAILFFIIMYFIRWI